MNDQKSGDNAPSSEDDIGSSVSLDPSLTSPGIGGFEEEHANPLDNIHVQARLLGGHAAERDVDPDDRGCPPSISGK